MVLIFFVFLNIITRLILSTCRFPIHRKFLVPINHKINIGKLKTTNKWHNTYRTNLETLPLPGVAPSGIKMKSNYPVIRLIIWNSCFDIVLIVVLSDAMLSDDENMRCLQIWSMYSIVDSIIIFEPTPSTKKMQCTRL